MLIGEDRAGSRRYLWTQRDIADACDYVRDWQEEAPDR
jgi:hypothetical protein